MLFKYIPWVKLLFLSSTCLFLPGGFNRPGAQKKWLVSENSSLCVNGSTNINKFSCDIPSYDQTDTLTITKGKSDKEMVLSGSIALKIQNFDCHNTIMTRDLRTTLKEKQFPKLFITFLSLSGLPGVITKPEVITGMVTIELVGITKRFEVNYQVSTDAQKVIHLIGARDINFSDFNLVPPRKLGGLIKTNDKLGVTFHLKMKELDQGN